MKNSQYMRIVFLALCLFYCSAEAAYWPSYTVSFMPPASINAALYSHILYAFADMNEQTFQVEEQDLMGEFTTTVQQKNPCVKTLISIGGGGSNSTAFALMATNPIRRAVFIKSAIALARRHAFHGLDLDWEFPSNTTEMENLGKLFSEWRHAINLESRSSGRPPLLLSAAVYYAHSFVVYGEHRSYPSASIAQNLDWVNVMCFDYHGSWDTSATGAHAALYDSSSNISTSYGISSWVESGIPPEKVVMGMPLYGKSWVLKSQNQTGIGAPAVAAGPKQNLSDESGIMFYSEITDFIRDTHATEVFDTESVSTYCYVGELWVGYDNQDSVAAKVKFAKQKGLLGYFFWAISQDSNWMLSTTASLSWNN
ncbi:nod factor hydrolase protein 1 isoform X2 [Cryptomeria japonica]|uniref:nod factor hydrolase protein 1 isoform X2 n=1 Tax=Cryptomeria japonica TaxID=3369 RepID=UPI0025AC895C|nr:nod factor hydrolase protein 1 isoform X2 [Cryptomeria japonica]